MSHTSNSDVYVSNCEVSAILPAEQLLSQSELNNLQYPSLSTAGENFNLSGDHTPLRNSFVRSVSRSSVSSLLHSYKQDTLCCKMTFSDTEDNQAQGTSQEESEAQSHFVLPEVDNTNNEVSVSNNCSNTLPGEEGAVSCMNTSEKSSSSTETVNIEEVKNELKEVQPCIQQTSDVVECLKHEADAEEEKSPQSGSQAIGVVGSGDVKSLQERLARHQEEQVAIASRLKESVVKREALMTRYMATKERLNNLKKQRTELAQREREILIHQGANESPYEDPIPGAENWSLAEIKSCLKDFQALLFKLERLDAAYRARMQSVDADDNDSRDTLNNKLNEIAVKQQQINDAIRRLQEFEQLREEELIAIGEADSEVKEELQEIETNLQQGFSSVELTDSSPEVSNDYQQKEEELHRLKQQLLEMKNLLNMNSKTSSGTTEDDEANTSHSLSNAVANNISEENEDIVANSTDDIYIEIKGKKLHLSGSELRDPGVFEKVQQLSNAKKRLKDIEDITQIVLRAQKSKQALSEVLSPEHLALLKDAEMEDVSNLNDSTSKKGGECRESSVCSGSTTHKFESGCTYKQRKSKKNCDDQGPYEKEPSRKDCQTDHRRKQQADMHEHQRITQEPSWQEMNNLVSNLATMQEDLCEKKNLIESLMKKLGKSSSACNAISDISDNESLDKEEEGIGASFGRVHMSEYSDLHHGARHRNRQELDDMDSNADIDTGENTVFVSKGTQAIQNSKKSQKQYNKSYSNYNQHETDYGLTAASNVRGFVPQSVKSKFKTYRDNGLTDVGIRHKSPSNTTVQTQNTITSALTQLNQMQHTINVLCETLRGELSNTMNAPLFNSNIANPLGYSTPLHQPALFNNVPGSSCFGISNASVSNSSNANQLNQITVALQQCLSQLHLHSLEIQSLGKQLQKLCSRIEDISQFSNFSKYCTLPESRNQVFLRRNKNKCQPSSKDAYMEHFNLISPEDEVQDDSRLPYSRTCYPNQHELADPSISCPLPSLRKWSSEEQDFCQNLVAHDAETASLPTSVNICVSDNCEEPSKRPVTFDSLTSEYTSGNSDILNNQVPPGMRANNYWDNFRSYSRQNLLSSSSKCNARGNFGIQGGEKHEKPRMNRSVSQQVGQKHFNIEQNYNSGARRKVLSRINNPRNKLQPTNSLNSSFQNIGESKVKSNNRAVKECKYNVSHNEPVHEFGWPNYSKTTEKMHCNDMRCNDAESVIRSHANHPEFLSKLFDIASEIKGDSNQHIALDMLQQLTNQNKFIPVERSEISRSDAQKKMKKTSHTMPSKLRNNMGHTSGHRRSNEIFSEIQANGYISSSEDSNEIGPREYRKTQRSSQIVATNPVNHTGEFEIITEFASGFSSAEISSGFAPVEDLCEADQTQVGCSSESRDQWNLLNCSCSEATTMELDLQHPKNNENLSQKDSNYISWITFQDESNNHQSDSSDHTC